MKDTQVDDDGSVANLDDDRWSRVERGDRTHNELSRRRRWSSKASALLLNAVQLSICTHTNTSTACTQPVGRRIERCGERARRRGGGDASRRRPWSRMPLHSIHAQSTHCLRCHWRACSWHNGLAYESTRGGRVRELANSWLYVYWCTCDTRDTCGRTYGACDVL